MTDRADNTQSKQWPDHYRYVTDLDERGVHISCRRFIVVGETPHFYYVVSDSCHGYLQCLSDEARKKSIKRNRRRVSKDGRARHCYPDKRLALQSLVARQHHRIWHAKRSLSEATLAMAEAERMLEAGHIPGDGDHPCGQDEYIESLCWGGY
ncbi:hypothetical protein QAO71_10680 [Halopseudomonas sp. SMJS2]|uniref:hypothetical protein n=1 Tax=Halopseudomonas sp. SMJS2 TaxID=3041098 RepID=UPI002452DAFC|nr:hypothetical protein [Halopseudomonas sp. SMJS2]WGK60558.1 hypothetical protein QAO71_10680 [Halopseudomonas sp. SMJS2]